MKTAGGADMRAWHVCGAGESLAMARSLFRPQHRGPFPRENPVWPERIA